jgi:fructokinase
MALEKFTYDFRRSRVRIGIDLGGTKTEALALDHFGKELARVRIDSPQRDYDATIAAMVAVVQQLETQTGQHGTVGAGIPGSIRANGLVKNANSTWLNGRPLPEDLSEALGREVRVANDANCLAVSEATDGAAKGRRVVFGVILGTGAGGGIAINGQVHAGPNGVAGEWGHNPLPLPNANEMPGPLCYCGRRGCMEMWVSGTGVARDHREVSGEALTTRQIAERWQSGDPASSATMQRFLGRLARGLANVVNILDPDLIVIGGGVSRVDRIYAELPGLIRPYVFGNDFDTPIVPAQFGDSSGVRGAAWLWPNT